MLAIHSERFLSMMREQAQIGATEAGGVSRPALFGDDLKIREWFKNQIEAAGLEYQIDGAGNQSAIWHCADPNAQTLLLGSHFDSVVNGGRFDGPLGVLSAFEALLTLKEAGQTLPFHLEVINFTDEEGTLVGLMGSSALCGLLSEADLQHPRGGRERLETAMQQIGISDESILAAKRNPETLLGYLEVHIEQGTRLIENELQIGAVDAIVGIRTYNLRFGGEAAHAGTMPIHKRHDAMRAASDFISAAFELVPRDHHPGVVNFGRIDVGPGGYNIVPDHVDLGMEFRHGNLEAFDALQAALLARAAASAAAYGVTLETQVLGSADPSPMGQSFVQAIEAASDKLGLQHTRLLSFAGHDAQALAQITNSAMFFVPSVDGISHNPKEFTPDADCINAANVMLHSVLAVAAHAS